MRILVDQSGYALHNMGDLAMLQVSIQRLQSIWSDAEIQVFTTAPHILRQYCPDTQPMKPLGRQIWFNPLLERIYQFLPQPYIAQAYRNWEWRLRLNAPYLVEHLLRVKLRNQPELGLAFEEFTAAIGQADLVIASGGGYLTDVFKSHALSIINTLGLAAKLGKPTVLLGQGIGPLGDRELLSKMKTVLPLVNFIGLREERAGRTLLNAIGVSPKRILTTGDDAIEMAYCAKPEKLGNGIGINLRVAEYSGLDSHGFNTIRAVLQTTAQKLNAPLLPVPISRNQCDNELSDSMAIQRLLQGYDDAIDDGWSLDTPLQVIQQVGRCRVVVTGSYHAGVFALSQGIPVISLVKSQYYADKFLGLADQFSVGCEVLRLDDPQVAQNLSSSIHHAWIQAEQLRPQILAAAERQIKLGYQAYQQVYQLVGA
jgi:polysaccharide pyruvyl transferase WcaK-like protein